MIWFFAIVISTAEEFTADDIAYVPSSFVDNTSVLIHHLSLFLAFAFGVVYGPDAVSLTPQWVRNITWVLVVLKIRIFVVVYARIGFIEAPNIV